MSDSVIKHAYLENEDSDIILAFAADICDSVEKTAVATEAHAKNSWFYSVPVRRLCKATSDIAIGANIVPGNGGNCIAQTIEELMANASNLAEPMSGDAFDDASSLDDGIYPIQEEDLQVIKSDMVECDDGNTVEEKLAELNAELIVFTNTSSTSQAPQTLSVANLQQYKWANVLVSYATALNYYSSFELPTDELTTYVLKACTSDGVKLYMGFRNFEIRANGIYIGDGYSVENGALKSIDNNCAQIRKITLHN